MTTRTLRRAVSDEDKEQRRLQILAAAKQVFADKGYHDTTMADVARGTGLSYGVVYWYFESKDDLFHALMTAEEQALRGHIATTVRRGNVGSGGVRDVLRDAARATFEYFERNPASTRLLFRDTSSLGDQFERELSDIFGRFTSDLEALVVDAQRRGRVRPAPARLVAFAWASMISQLALRRQRTDDGLRAAEAADFAVDLLIEGLACRPGEERGHGS